MPNVVARRRGSGRVVQPSVTRYFPAARAAYGIARAGYNAYKKYKSSPASKGTSESAPIFGSTFTARTTYKSKRRNRRRVRFGKSKTNKFLHQTMKLQNAQNSVQSGAFGFASINGTQDWQSIDFLNGADLNVMCLSQQPAAVTPVAARDWRLFIQSCRLNVMLRNTGATVAFVELYWVTPRFDISSNEIPLTVPSVGNSLRTWFVGHLPAAGTSDMNQDPAGDPIPTNQTLGMTPFQYQNFCRLFKINKVKTVKLPPGEVYQEYFNTRFRNVDAVKLNANSYLRGITSSLLWRFRGFHDGTNQAPSTAMYCNWELLSCIKVVQTRNSSTGGLVPEA